MNYYNRHIGDYAKDTGHLSMIEDGAYSRMMDVYYGREQPLPKEREKLYRLVRVKGAAERKAVDDVLAEFFQERGDGWHHKRCDEEIERAVMKSEKARASAFASVESRERKNRQIRSERMALANEKGTHTKDEWLRLVDACGNKCVKCGAEGHLDKDHVVPVYRGGSNHITNLQPLCARCNAAKGPEDVDYVPLSVRSAFAQRSLNDGLAPNSQEPIANSQVPLTTSPDVEVPDGTPDCPHEKIIELYHTLLPECPRVLEWTDARRGYLRQRWREKAKPNGISSGYRTVEHGLAWWKRFLSYVAQSEFLTGKSDAKPGRKPFTADLEWIVKSANFARIIEGKYHG